MSWPLCALLCGHSLGSQNRTHHASSSLGTSSGAAPAVWVPRPSRAGLRNPITSPVAPAPFLPRLLRQVAVGASCLCTSHGKPAGAAGRPIPSSPSPVCKPRGHLSLVLVVVLRVSLRGARRPRGGDSTAGPSPRGEEDSLLFPDAGNPQSDACTGEERRKRV